jgi:putative ABC transport system permease protein
MGTLYQDIRFAIRTLVKNPGFTIPAVLCLALGIGACTAVFSMVDTVLLRPLPYTNPERLVAIDEHNLKQGYGMGGSPRLLCDMREQTQSFEEIAFSEFGTFNLAGGEFPEKVDASRVSTNMFKVLGAKPLLGRTFLPGEDQSGNSNIAVISHSLWQRRFGGDPNLVGGTITFTDTSEGDQVYTVVGIMPPLFLPCRSIGKCEVWVPKVFQPDELDARNPRLLLPFGRLKVGVTRKQAQAEADVLVRRLEKQYPQFYEGWIIQVQPLRSTFVAEEIRKSLWVLLGAVAFVLLIACANVANMLLARSASRQAEIAVRATLGAGRWRLIRQLLTESLLLAIFGTGLGMLFTYWGIDILKTLVPGSLPLAKDIGMDARMLGFTLAVLVITGVSCGLAPARRLSKPNLAEALKDGGSRFIAGPGRRPLRDLLVISQVALALILLVGAGLMIQSLVRLLRLDPGFNTRNLMVFSVRLPLVGYKDGAQMNTFREQLLARIGSLPGVVSIGAVTERQDSPCSVGTYDYFRTMGISLLQGRYLTDEDITGGDNNIIVNETAARERWPDDNPIGKRIDFDLGRFLTVVGVVKTIRSHSYHYDAGPKLYIPYQTFDNLRRAMPSDSEFVVRSTGDPLSLIKAIRSEITALDKRLPVTGFTTLEGRLRRSAARQRLYMRLLAAFAVMGLILTVVGIYGVISYVASRRTHEIGIRIALGAQRGDVFKLVIRKGVTLIVVGLVIGVAGALALTRVLAGLLHGVTPTDPMTFVLVSLLLTAVGLLACYVPARRAAKIDPMTALRCQ